LKSHTWIKEEISLWTS